LFGGCALTGKLEELVLPLAGFWGGPLTGDGKGKEVLTING